MTGTRTATSPGGTSTPRRGALHSARRDEDKRGNELSDNSNECLLSTPRYMSELSYM
jgi:hypothetical protein